MHIDFIAFPFLEDSSVSYRAVCVFMSKLWSCGLSELSFHLRKSSVTKLKGFDFLAFG